MTILLIERCGRVHELEVPSLVPRLYIPVFGGTPFGTTLWWATFALTGELSYPPVYRWVA